MRAPFNLIKKKPKAAAEVHSPIDSYGCQYAFPAIGKQLRKRRSDPDTPTSEFPAKRPPRDVADTTPSSSSLQHAATPTVRCVVPVDLDANNTAQADDRAAVAAEVKAVRAAVLTEEPPPSPPDDIVGDLAMGAAADVANIAHADHELFLFEDEEGHPPTDKRVCSCLPKQRE